MRNFDWYAQTGWEANTLRNEKTFPVGKLNTPATAPVVVNAFWKGRRMFSPAGGGVSIVAEHALQQMTADATLTKQHEAMRPDADITSWWWD